MHTSMQSPKPESDHNTDNLIILNNSPVIPKNKIVLKQEKIDFKQPLKSKKSVFFKPREEDPTTQDDTEGPKVDTEPKRPRVSEVFKKDQ